MRKKLKGGARGKHTGSNANTERKERISRRTSQQETDEIRKKSERKGAKRKKYSI